MKRYLRPLVQLGAMPPQGARRLAAGWSWFERVEMLSRSGAPEILPVSALDRAEIERLCTPRPPLADLDWQVPRVMGVLNVTPDSFSDGGLFSAPSEAIDQGVAMEIAGADVIDLGGESTRPGAETVSPEMEIGRVVPVIEALSRKVSAPISIDTRKAAVARAGATAGAALINDVSGLTYDDGMAATVAATGLPVCVMHAQGAPETMQSAPHYDDVLLDVYDELEGRVARAEAAGVPRARVIVDPGIGFGKTLAHNLALLRGLSIFHGLGCVVLLGASRKKFIGTLSGAEAPDARMPGSLAVALAGIAQGVQMVRVHDVAATRQAITLYMAATGAGEGDET